MSAVVVSRHDNVVDVDFRPDPTPPGSGREASPWWPWAEGTVPAADRSVSRETPAATRPTLPARYSPRPVRVLRRRFARSEFAADLRDYGWFLGFLGAAVVVVAWLDPTSADIARLINGVTP